jgi:hypothetical protein
MAGVRRVPGMFGAGFGTEDAGVIRVSLTEKGMAYAVRATPTVATIRLSDMIVDEVTGIATDAGNTEARADYVWRYCNVSPFGNRRIETLGPDAARYSPCSAPGTHTDSAGLRYDDRWKIPNQAAHFVDVPILIYSSEIPRYLCRSFV